ncbi:hypothetical protein PLICRDRAFT_49578 [Plicaturopsis crispa FD-325 SS-3]|nr:hypothetical protein PLICRDRAFT_49578 [Plicaturopsis crispa FD-325 SS-3]
MEGTLTAKSMLDEIHSESLQKVLSSVAFETSPPGCTGIPGLDAHFFSSVPRHASSQSSLNRGDVIEIQGPASCGKTHLLYQMIVNCTLPHPQGGWNKAVIVFDTDSTFDVRRLHELFVSRITRVTAEYNDPTAMASTEVLASEALARVHIFRPTSSSQLAASLLHLPVYQGIHLPEAEVGLLAIDSMSAFYWPDRFTVEQLRSLAEPGRSLAVTSPLQHVLDALQKYRILYSPVTVLTNWGLNPLTGAASSSNIPLNYKQHLHPFPVLSPPSTDGAPEQATARGRPVVALPLTHHITLPFSAIPPFTPDISLAEAEEQESKYRKEIIEKGEVVGYARSSGSLRVGRFVFNILEGES